MGSFATSLPARRRTALADQINQVPAGIPIGPIGSQPPFGGGEGGAGGALSNLRNILPGLLPGGGGGAPAPPAAQAGIPVGLGGGNPYVGTAPVSNRPVQTPISRPTALQPQQTASYNIPPPPPPTSASLDPFSGYTPPPPPPAGSLPGRISGSPFTAPNESRPGRIDLGVNPALEFLRRGAGEAVADRLMTDLTNPMATFERLPYGQQQNDVLGRIYDHLMNVKGLTREDKFDAFMNQLLGGAASSGAENLPYWDKSSSLAARLVDPGALSFYDKTSDLTRRMVDPGSLMYEDKLSSLAGQLGNPGDSQFGQGLTAEEARARTELAAVPLQRARQLASQDITADAARRGFTSGDAPAQERLARLDEALAREMGLLGQQSILTDADLRRSGAQLGLQRQQTLADLIARERSLGVGREGQLSNLLLGERGLGAGREGELADLILGTQQLGAGQQAGRERLAGDIFGQERGRETASNLAAAEQFFDVLGQERGQAGQQQDAARTAATNYLMQNAANLFNWQNMFEDVDLRKAGLKAASAGGPDWVDLGIDLGTMVLDAFVPGAGAAIRTARDIKGR